MHNKEDSLSSEIEIKSTRGEAYLRIKIFEKEKIGFPSVQFRTIVRDEAVSGHFLGGWVRLDEFADFVTNLRLCEETRQGKASLPGLSPDEWNVTIEQKNGWGHFWLRYSFRSFITRSKSSHAQSTEIFRTLSGDFDLDASLFVQHVLAFEALLQEAHP